MSIITAVTDAQLQTFSHFLQEFEGEGLSSLTELRRKVNNELHTRNKQRKPFYRNANPQTRSQTDKKLCPNCRKEMLLGVTDDGEVFYGCKGCYFSELVCN